MGLKSEGKSFPVLGVGGGTLTLGGLWTRKSNSNENSCDLISRAGGKRPREDGKGGFEVADKVQTIKCLGDKAAHSPLSVLLSPFFFSGLLSALLAVCFVSPRYLSCLFLSVYPIRPPCPARNSCQPREQSTRSCSLEQEAGTGPGVENLYSVA